MTLGESDGSGLARYIGRQAGRLLGWRLSLEQCLSPKLSSVHSFVYLHASRCVCKSSRIVVHSAVERSTCPVQSSSSSVCGPSTREAVVGRERVCAESVCARAVIWIGWRRRAIARRREEAGVVNDITKMYNHWVGGGERAEGGRSVGCGRSPSM